MSARLAVVGRLDGLVVRHLTALQPDASCGDPPATYPYASSQNRNGQPTFGLTSSYTYSLNGRATPGSHSQVPQPTARNGSRDRIGFKQPFARSRAVVTS
jgi:hypothetical protein